MWKEGVPTLFYLSKNSSTNSNTVGSTQFVLASAVGDRSQEKIAHGAWVGLWRKK